MKPVSNVNQKLTEPESQIVTVKILTMKPMTKNVKNVNITVPPVKRKETTVPNVPETEKTNQIVTVLSELSMMENPPNVPNVTKSVTLVKTPPITVPSVPKPDQKETHHQVAQLSHKESKVLKLKLSQSDPPLLLIVLVNVKLVPEPERTV